MAWVAIAQAAASAYASSQKKPGSTGLAEMGMGARNSIFDTSGWNVATGGSRMDGVTATSGAKSNAIDQTQPRPTVGLPPQYIDGGTGASVGGVDLTTALAVGGGLLLLVVVVAARKRR